MAHWNPVDKVQDLVNKMGGEININRFLSGELVLVEKSSLKPFMIEVRDFAVWKTVTLGLYKSSKDYRQALEEAGYRVGDSANQMLDRAEVSRTEIKLDLVVVTLDELGFKESARREEVYFRAIKLGLQLCPAEVGPALRLLYKDQPRGERLRIGMDYVYDAVDYPRIFGVDVVDGVRQLGGHYGAANYIWTVNYRWVFVRPRK